MENNSDGHDHRIPPYDIIEHEEKESCPCRPEWERKNKMAYLSCATDVKLLLHNRMADNIQ